MARQVEYGAKGGGASGVDSTARTQAAAAQTAIDSVVAEAGDSVAVSGAVFAAGYLWENRTAAAITIPATVTPTTLTTAGLTKSTATVTVDEVVLSNTALTGTAPAGAKLGRDVVAGKSYEVIAGSWAEILAAGNAQHYAVTRASTADTAPTTAETRTALEEGDTAKILTTDGTVRNWRYQSGAWSLRATEVAAKTGGPPAWTADTNFAANDEVSATIMGAAVTLRRNTAGTSGAALDVAELGNWTLTGQQPVVPLVAGASLPVGFSFVFRAVQYRVTAATDSAATITTAMNPNVKALAYGSTQAWAANTRVNDAEGVRLPVAGTLASVFLSSTAGNRLTGAQFDATEMGFWRATGQSLKPDQTTWTLSGSFIPTTFEIEVVTNGTRETWICNTPHTGAATWVADQTNWRRVAIDNAGVPTLRLANGGTPAANNVYVQAIGDTHIAPTLTAGQRTTVINLRATGGAIETTYLHDGVAQSVMQASSSSPAEVVPSTTALSGAAPAGATFGYNSTTNTLYTVVAGNWQAIPVVNAADVIFAASAPDAANTTQTVWVDVSAARWPVYRRALAADAWPATADGHVFEATAANGTVQNVTDRLDAAREWTPLIVSDVLRDFDTTRFKHYKSGETIDFNALHNGANTRAIRMFSFSAGTNLTNPPQSGAALGVTGHGYYVGDATDGHQFVYFLKDSLDRETEYYRERSASTWTAWQAVSSDGWQGSKDDMQISSGMHVVIADNHKVHFLASDRVRAIRLIPDSDWSKVGTITPGNSWTFDGEFPATGRQEVVLVPAPVADVWNVSAMIAADAKPAFIQRTTTTGSSAPTATEFADPANGDTVSVLLSDGDLEVWRYADDAWAVASTIPATPDRIPTVQAGLGTAIKIHDYGRPSNFHLNSANGAVTWAVAGAPDGIWHYLTNTGTVDATVTFSGHTKVYLRDGRANTDLTATLTAKPGEQYLVHLTKNGTDYYVNAARLSAATGAAARNITGSATATGYDDVAVPVSITLAAGKALDTVTATNGALVTNINSLLGTCLVTAKGQNTVLSHTTKNAVAYNGLQRVGDKDFAAAQLTSTATDYTLDVTLQEGDLLEITENYNNNATEDHVHWIRIAAGRQATAFQYPGTTNGLKVLAPATLDNKVKLSTTGSGNQYLRRIRVWRDAANGFVVPTGTEVRTACDVTCNAGAVNVNGGPSARAYAGTSMRISIALPTGQRLDTVTASNGGVVAIADLFTGTIELAVPQGTTGAIALTATFTNIVPRVGRSITTADGGVIVPCGTIEVRLPASGNRSIQMRSVLGTLACRAATTWADGGNTANIVTSLTTAWTYANSTWNFTTAGQWQDVLFIDQTNNRTYRIKMTIGASYNANQFWIEEMLE
jgi:hypothetical protein